MVFNYVICIIMCYWATIIIFILKNNKVDARKIAKMLEENNKLLEELKTKLKNLGESLWHWQNGRRT
mgnify:CR=1 FL=1